MTEELAITAHEDSRGTSLKPAKGLFLLFPSGQRPGRAEIRQFVKANPQVSLTFDPADTPLRVVGESSNEIVPQRNLNSGANVSNWVELLGSGLAFDLIGLSEGESCSLPVFSQKFDFDHVADGGGYEGVCLLPGDHLSGGERSLPILRSMMGLARDFLSYFDSAEAILWPPARSLVGRMFFESTITAWLDGGPFPALGLTSFELTDEGALMSVGLEHLIGQELQVDPSLAENPAAGTRLGVRLINQLVLSGAVETADQIIAPDGAKLMLEPIEGGKILRVRAE